MPQQYDNMSNALCSEHREGIICGKCKKGYGVSVTTAQLICIPCKDSQLATNTAVYWFMTFIQLVAFFILLALLKIRISNGVMNSFTLYTQAILTAIYRFHPRKFKLLLDCLHRKETQALEAVQYRT